MRIRFFFSFFVILFLSSFFSHAESIQNFPLEKISSFPSEEDEVAFRVPTDFDIDENGNFYVMDQISTKLYKFSNQGKLISSLIKQGQGPEEMRMPNFFSYYKGKLYVNDQGNMRFAILDANTGKQISNFRYFNAIDRFDINDSGIFSSIMKRSQEKTFQLSHFDFSGKLINEFGKYIADIIDKSFPPQLSQCEIKIYKDKIYLVSSYYPIIQVYSIKGKLLQEKHLKRDEYLERTPGNYDKSYLFKDPNYIKTKWLFTNFSVNEDGIFIAVYADKSNDDKRRLEIHHYNFDFQLKSRYLYSAQASENFSFTVRDLLIKKVNNFFWFYILNAGGDNMILTFKGKTS